MSVDFISSSQSELSYGDFSFSWLHPTKSSEKGIVVFTFAETNNDDITAVTYGGQSLTAVANGRALDSSGSLKECKAWFLGSNLSQTFATNNANGVWMLQDNPLVNAKSVAYNNNQYVITGAEGTYYTTQDITNNSWTATNVGAGSFVTYLDNKWIVCVDNHLAYSSNLTTFSNIYFNSYQYYPSCIAFDSINSVWVVLVWDNTITKYKILQSNSLFGPWTENSTVFFDYGDFIAYGNGYWVVSSFQKMYYTTNPLGNWTEITAANINLVYSGPEGDNYTYAPKRRLKFVNGHFVATTAYGFIYHATNPSGTWQETDLTYGGLPNSGIVYIGNYGYYSREIHSIDYGDGYWISVGELGGIYYATNLSGPWSRTASSNKSAVGVTFEDVVYGNGRFFAVGSIGSGSYSYCAYSNCLAKEIVVTKNYNMVYTAGVAATVSSSENALISNVVLNQNNQNLSEQLINDNNPGSASLRFAAINSGLSYIQFYSGSSTDLSFGLNSQFLNQISTGGGGFIYALAKEKQKSRGIRPVGFLSSTVDDTAAVYLAVSDTAVVSSNSFKGWGISII